MKKIILAVLVAFVIGVSPALASGATEDPGPTAHLKVDICHNGTIVPVSVNAVSTTDTGHGLFDPKTFEFTARADTPGHSGDTLVRAYLKAGPEEVVVHSNPEAECSLNSRPDHEKISIEVCINGEVKLFEGIGKLETLRARVDAFLKLRALGEFIKVGTTCTSDTTTTSVKHEVLSEEHRVDQSPTILVPVDNAAPHNELPRTGSGTTTMAVIGIIFGIAGLSLLLVSAVLKRLD